MVKKVCDKIDTCACVFLFWLYVFYVSSVFRVVSWLQCVFRERGQEVQVGQVVFQEAELRIFFQFKFFRFVMVQVVGDVFLQGLIRFFRCGFRFFRFGRRQCFRFFVRVFYIRFIVVGWVREKRFLCRVEICVYREAGEVEGGYIFLFFRED